MKPPRLTLSSLFSDHMVLQRGRPICFFGKGTPGTQIFATFRDATSKTKVDDTGRWSVKFAATKAGGPYTLEVNDGEKCIHRNDILIGDVWVCSGQSNMARILMNTFASAQEVPAARYPGIRHYRVPPKESDTPIEDPEGSWKVCNPQNAGDFTAVGYFFARDIHQEMGVPIGLLHCAWGGSEIEPFVPLSVFEKDARFHLLLERQNALIDVPKHRLGTHFNGMVHALCRLGIKGFVWYQGESNIRTAENYSRLFPAMIRAWRQEWQNDDLPFYFVQLPNYCPEPDSPSNIGFPEIRAAQEAALELKNTGMTVSLDIGQPDDIHPFDKRELGRRIALQVLAKSYFRNRIWSGPRYAKHKPHGNTLEVEFHEVGRGLRAADGHPLRGFEIAGRGGQFFPATAEVISKNKIRLTTDQVPRPMDVCYAWSGNPRVNLVNDSGLPTAPFRTDSWTWASAGVLWPD